MKEKEPRRFTFEKVKRKGRLKGIILGFVAFVLVFGTAAGAYLYTKTDFINKEKILSFFDKSGDRDSLSGVEGKSANILFISISSGETIETGEKEIYFMVLAHADTKQGKIKFCPLPVKNSYLQYFELGGVSEICTALEEEYNIKIDRYVSSNENTFALAINYMGGLQYTVSENVTYRTPDLTLILTPGYQTLKGENLLKYLKYFKEKDLSMQGELFCKMVENYLTEKNMENAMQLFKGVMSNLADNTNVSYVDAADNLDSIEVFVKNVGANTQTVSTVDEL